MFKFPAPQPGLLSTSELATLEAISEKIRDHLIAQGEPAVQRTGPRLADTKCMYRLPREGQAPLMCAVGCLIDDTHYSEQIEGEAAHAYPVTHAVLASLQAEGFILPDDDPMLPEGPMLAALGGLLTLWQRYHDGFIDLAGLRDAVAEGGLQKHHDQVMDKLRKTSARAAFSINLAHI